MKILMITPYLPYPLVSGGQIRTYNLLKNLHKKHQITLMSFIREQDETKHIPELEKFCHRVITFKRTPHAWHPRNILLSGLTPYPFVVCLYLYKKVRQAIERELKKNSYDLIHAETFYVMPNIPQTRLPILLVEQVIEFLVYHQFTQMLPPLATPLKPLLYLDVTKIKRWERHYWKRAIRLAAMSQEDKNYMLHLEPGLEINVIANGVDVPHFTKIKKIKPPHPTVLFIGNFKWLPNRDAAKFLVNQIWPHIIKEIPQARLWVVGRFPTPDILSLAQKNIKVDGEVEDIRYAYANSSVLLAPIRNGRGTKYKILEAMATHTPIVGTPLAIEGIGIKSGTHALVSEQPQKLADHTINILKNAPLGRRLAANAFQFVSQTYSWTTISQQLDQVYQQLGRSHTT
jgi:glycosyltransferase involved in cell wall biosynthesis